MLWFHQCPFPTGLHCILHSVSVTLRCPLPLAVDDADFIRNLLVGFGSGSIGLPLKPRAADAAGSGSSIAAAVLYLILFLFSPLCISSANASLTTSLLRSSLSAPCGVIMRHSSIRTLQRSEWACALLLSLITLQQGHPTVAPNSSMYCLVTLSLWIRAPSNGNGGIGIGSTRMSGLNTVHLSTVILPGTPTTFLMAPLSHLLHGSNLLIFRV